MVIKIGAVIRNLRNKNNITQESLATYLGVTPQAISRWESQTCYPDLEILPSIASFFNITVDELLGINMDEKQARMQEIHREIFKRMELGDSNEETLKQARIYAAEFPSDEFVQSHLANEICRVHMWAEKPDINLLSEAEKLYQTIIENTNDPMRKALATRALASLYYNGFKSRELALKTVQTLPSMIWSVEAVASNIFGKDNPEQRQLYLFRLTHLLVGNLYDYIAYQMPNEPQHWDEKIEMFEYLIGFLRFMYGDDMKNTHQMAANIYRYIATYTIAQGKNEETLDYLEKMLTEYSKAPQEKGRENETFASPFFNQLRAGVVYGYDENNHVHNWAYYILNKLTQQERYDPIRETDRFKAILTKLSEMAKTY